MSLVVKEAFRSFILNPVAARSLFTCNVCRTGGNYAVQSRHYAKPAGAKKLAAGKVGKIGATTTRVRLEVETDPQKLCNFLCGGNIYKEGADPPLKPDSEYPEWLWKLKTTREPIPLEDLDPDTWAYWKRLSLQDQARYRRIDKLRHKFKRY